MDNPNLLNCLILTRNTLSLFLPPSLHQSSLLHPSFSSSLLSYLSLLLPPALLFSLSLFLFPFLFLPSLSPPLFRLSSIRPSIKINFYAHSLFILLSMTLLIPLYSSLYIFFPPSFFLSLSLPPSLSPSPPLYVFFITHYNNLWNLLQLHVVTVTFP